MSSVTMAMITWEQPRPRKHSGLLESHQTLAWQPIYFPICSQLRSGDTNLPAWVCCFSFSLSFFSFFLLQTKTGTSVGRWRSLFHDEAALTQIAVASVDPHRVKEAPYSSPSLFVVLEQTVKSPDEPRPEARRPRRQHAPTGP